MPRKYIRKFRGFPNLTPERKAKIVEALSVGTPIEIACEYAGIAKSTFYRWQQAGFSLPVGEERPYLPDFRPRQPDEDAETWDKRNAACNATCQMLEELFLECMQNVAEVRVRWLKKMNERAMKGDFSALAWLLERTCPEHFALVAVRRNGFDAKAAPEPSEVAKLLAEAFALLGHPPTGPPAWQTTALLDGNETDSGVA